MYLTSKQLPPRLATLLLFLNDPARRELDPVRIMKGMFVLSKEAPIQWLPADERYQFEPYHYGPCAFDIYGDLDALIAEGFVSFAELPGASWKKYTVTASGAEAALAEASRMNPGLVQYINSVRDFVCSLSFSGLLKAIYQKYPEYAVNSVFQR